MRKIISFALAAAMMMAMSVSVFATDLTTNPTEGLAEGIYDIPLNIDFDSDGDGIVDSEDDTAVLPVSVIAVDIAWSDMSFVYVAGGTKYDPETMTESVVDAGWKNETRTVTVSNRSNVGITAKFSYNYDSDTWESLGANASNGFSLNFAGAVGTTFADNTLTLDRATLGTGGENGTATTGTVNVTRTGDWVPEVSGPMNAVTVGSVRIEIAGVGGGSAGGSAVETVSELNLEATGYENGPYSFTVKRNQPLTVSVSSTFGNVGDVTSSAATYAVDPTTSSMYTWAAPTLTVTDSSVSEVKIQFLYSPGTSGDPNEEPLPEFSWDVILTVVD